jgi:hypothetical protein
MSISERIRVAIIGCGLIGTEWERPCRLPLFFGPHS